MDTISINIHFKRKFQNYLDYEELQKKVNSIISPYGYTYCDYGGIKKNDVFNLKVSYPRFYKGINAYLIKNSIECLKVNEHLVVSLEKELKVLSLDVVMIELIRVDIPFTYYMPDVSFEKCLNIFRVLAYAYNKSRREEKNSRTDTKGIIDMITSSIETVNFTIARGSGGNNELTIYNQYLNIKRKTASAEQFEEYLRTYPDLKSRIRFEVKKRVNRNKFLPKDFKEFDILRKYSESYKKFLLKYVFNKKSIAEIYEMYSMELDITYQEYLKKHKRINYVAWLHSNKHLLIDYKMIRKVLEKNINNQKTLENAITCIRKELKEIENKDFLVLNVAKIIDDMRQIIKNYKFEYKLNVEIKEEILIQEYFSMEDNMQFLLDEPLDDDFN